MRKIWTMAVCAVVLVGLAASAGSAWDRDDHGRGHEDGDACCAGPTVTPVSVGDPNCPFGGVKITATACCDKGKDKKCTPPPPSYVCNGAPGEQGEPGAPADGGDIAYAYVSPTQGPPPTVPPGPGTVTVATVTVPQGSYLVHFKAETEYDYDPTPATPTGNVVCGLAWIDAASPIPLTNFIDAQTVETHGPTTIALLGTFNVAAPANVIVYCGNHGSTSAPVTIQQIQLVAEKVEAIIYQP